MATLDWMHKDIPEHELTVTQYCFKNPKATCRDHYRVVVQALLDNLSVSPRVLQEYPALQKADSLTPKSARRKELQTMKKRIT